MDREREGRKKDRLEETHETNDQAWPERQQEETQM